MSQGLLGADSPKPTGLLALNLPGLPQQLVRWALRPDLPKGRSIGRDGTGAFKTAGFKEYPPAMCAALASSFFDFIQRSVSSEVSSTVQNVPQDFLNLCVSMTSTDLAQSMDQILLLEVFLSFFTEFDFCSAAATSAPSCSVKKKIYIYIYTYTLSLYIYAYIYIYPIVSL